jgi:hypothetical protein
MASAAKTEPTIEAGTEASGAASAVAPVASAAASPQPMKLDRASRIEDETARIEEKFARSEERMMRVESALEKATIRLEGATQDMNLQGVRDDMSRMREDLRAKPGVATLFVVALVATLIGAAVTVGVLKFGIPGVLSP